MDHEREMWSRVERRVQSATLRTISGRVLVRKQRGGSLEIVWVEIVRAEHPEPDSLTPSAVAVEDHVRQHEAGRVHVRRAANKSGRVRNRLVQLFVGHASDILLRDRRQQLLDRVCWLSRIVF